MKYLVLWSGGLDSTALIFRLLKAGHNVTAVHAKIANNVGKAVCERKAIDAIRAVIMEDYSFPQFYFDEGTVEVSASIGTTDHIGLIQPPIWLMSAFFLCRDKFDAVALGYVVADDANSYIDEHRRLWKALWGFSNSVKMPRLEFPIMKEAKRPLYDELPSSVRQSIWWCEHPNKLNVMGDDVTAYGECRECEPCRTAAYFKIREGHDVIVTEVVRRDDDMLVKSAAETVLSDAATYGPIAKAVS